MIETLTLTDLLAPAVLIGVFLWQGGSLRREIKSLRNEFTPQLANLTKAVAGNTEALAEVRRDLAAVDRRVARIEGALTGPWLRPR